MLPTRGPRGGELLRRLASQHSDVITDIVVSQDGDRLALCSADCTVSVWDRAPALAPSSCASPVPPPTRPPHPRTAVDATAAADALTAAFFGCDAPDAACGTAGAQPAPAPDSDDAFFCDGAAEVAGSGAGPGAGAHAGAGAPGAAREGDPAAALQTLRTRDAWVCTAEWSAHRRPVLGLDWAPPQHGQMLATVGADHTLAFWVELQQPQPRCTRGPRTARTADDDDDEVNGALGHSSRSSNSSSRDGTDDGDGGGGRGRGRRAPDVQRWAPRCRVAVPCVDATCVRFGPEHLEPCTVAVGSATAGVCVYVCTAGELMSCWELKAQFGMLPYAVPLTGNDPRSATPAGASASGNRSNKKSSSSSGGGGLGTVKEEEEEEREGEEDREAHGGCVDLSWCGSPFEPQMLAVASARDNAVQIWRAGGSSAAWTVVGTLACGSPVRSVAWCPNYARLDQLVAVACRDDVTLWSLHFARVCVAAGTGTGAPGTVTGAAGVTGVGSLSASASATLGNHPSRTPSSPLGSPLLGGAAGSATAPLALPPPVLVPVVAPGARPEAVRVCRLLPQRCDGTAPWQLQWGVFGTRIACMYEDGTLCVWKIIAPGTWELTSEISGTASAPTADTDHGST